MCTTRFQRNSLRCSHRGTVSPMASLEPLIFEIALQKGRMNQPLTVGEGLRLSNSLIKPGSKIEKDLISYLSKRSQYSSSGSKTKIPGKLKIQALFRKMTNMKNYKYIYIYINIRSNGHATARDGTRYPYTK